MTLVDPPTAEPRARRRIATATREDVERPCRVCSDGRAVQGSGRGARHDLQKFLLMIEHQSDRPRVCLVISVRESASHSRRAMSAPLAVALSNYIFVQETHDNINQSESVPNICAPILIKDNSCFPLSHTRHCTSKILESTMAGVGEQHFYLPTNIRSPGARMQITRSTTNNENRTVCPKTPTTRPSL